MPRKTIYKQPKRCLCHGCDVIVKGTHDFCGPHFNAMPSNVLTNVRAINMAYQAGDFSECTFRRLIEDLTERYRLEVIQDRLTSE